MRTIEIGKTGMLVPQNAFGALPIQRIPLEEAKTLLQNAYKGGMRFFDTARAYTDSEEKVGAAFKGIRENLYLATKTKAKTPAQFWEDLETSLSKLQTDYIDLYQFHMVDQCYKPEDGTGMYECMLEAKAQGKIRHIGITTHKIQVAHEIVESGLYETLQYPFSYLSKQEEIELVQKCKEYEVGFIVMKGLAGGILSNAKAIFAYLYQFDHVLPIWGIQRQEELEEWLSFMDQEPALNEELKEVIAQDRKQYEKDFCRGCGYCMPCPVGIDIPTSARASILMRKMNPAIWGSKERQEVMKKTEDCVNCRTCVSRCPYELNIPELLKKNYADYLDYYKDVIGGE
ncbi:MAG: aldo/keto reductase [Solobacterium sp.]|nr:aldo/keto reductase [Solobacterium sp.]